MRVTITTNAARRRFRRDAAKTAKGSLSVPSVQPNSHIGVCSLRNRSGLINDEGVCTGYRSITAMPFFEPRSKRCETIVDTKKKISSGGSSGIMEVRKSDGKAHRISFGESQRSAQPD